MRVELIRATPLPKVEPLERVIVKGVGGLSQMLEFRVIPGGANGLTVPAVDAFITDKDGESVGQRLERNEVLRLCDGLRELVGGVPDPHRRSALDDVEFGTVLAVRQVLREMDLLRLIPQRGRMLLDEILDREAQARGMGDADVVAALKFASYLRSDDE